MSTSNLLYAAAKRGLEEGLSGVFAANSVFMGGGGAKGVPLPDDLEEVICKFFNTRAHDFLLRHDRDEQLLGAVRS